MKHFSYFSKAFAQEQLDRFPKKTGKMAKWQNFETWQVLETEEKKRAAGKNKRSLVLFSICHTSFATPS
jgi:hypothetical protein